MGPFAILESSVQRVMEEPVSCFRCANLITVFLEDVVYFALESLQDVGIDGVVTWISTSATHSMLTYSDTKKKNSLADLVGMMLRC